MNTLKLILCQLLFMPLAIFGQSYQNDPKLQKGKAITSHQETKTSIAHSVLATGSWYRFYIEKTGIYKITPQFLSDLGMNTSTIDPATIKIYGNGGHMLPLRNDKNHEFDLKENTIKVIGGEDGVLSGEDHILFYGVGTRAYNADSNTHVNLYDDKSYYFITATGKKGSRVLKVERDILNKKADTIITTYRDKQFYEIDHNNLALMGRRWFGDKIEANQKKSVSFYIPNKVDTASVKYSIVAAAQSRESSKLDIRINRKQKEEIKFSPLSNGMIAREGKLEKTVHNSSDTIRFDIQYQVNNNSLGKSYLDYIRISTERFLVGSDKQFEFVIPAFDDDQKTSKIQLKNTQKISEIWDVTHQEAIVVYENSLLENQFSFTVKTNESRKYITVSTNDFYQPLKTKKSKVENQDLKGTIFLNKQGDFEDIDYLIITHKNMVRAAERLAKFHRDYNKMNVKVVPVHKIYNEFSSGKQDIGAIRNFIRYVYEHASSEAKKLSYVCLMGNATVDYKHKMINNSAFATYKKSDVPSYMSYNSFYNIRSYVSDDYFVMMDPEEGEMKLKDDLDIVIGRILTDNSTADEIVDKFLRYHHQDSYGDWRNNLLLLSDDVDKRWEQKIQENLNDIGDSLTYKFPFLNISKIYSDAYIQKSTVNGERYPEVTKALIDKIEKGVAVLDYFGHAEEEGFGIEFFFTKKDVIDLKNKNKLPLFITVTCLATRFDNPYNISIGEYIFKSPRGGAIAMIATTREIAMTAGVRINNKVIDELFSENGQHIKPAEAVLRLKNELRNQHKRNVFFIGDPAMSLHMPMAGAKITSINSIPIHKFNDVLQALDKVHFSGEIVDKFEKVRKDFNGEVSIKIFDKEIHQKTLGNNKIKNKNKELIQLDFTNQGPLIFSGNAPVTNGKFDLEFVIPKDIEMSVGDAKISIYATNNNKDEDVFGVKKIVVGGLSDATLTDTLGPEITISVDGKTSKEIYVATSNAALELRIDLADENGINLSTRGIGHQVQMIIDKKEQVLLNDWYKNKTGTYQKGFIIYPLKKLPTGYHTLQIKAWDTYNNSSTKEIKLLILDSL